MTHFDRTLMRLFSNDLTLCAVAAVVVVVIGIWFRMHALDTVPPGLAMDEANNAVSAALSLQTHDYRGFYAHSIFTLTGPFIWLLSLALCLFGDSLWALRFIPALIGSVTLICFFFLCKEYWRHHKHADQLALLSVAFLATSQWSLHTTRLVYHGTLAPLCEILALWGLLVALYKGTIGYYALAGAALALGLYSYWQYPPFMLLPAAVLLLSALKKHTNRKQLAAYVLSALVMSAPFIIESIERKTMFTRIQALSITRGSSSEHNLLEKGYGLFSRIKENAAYTVGMLFLGGDKNWRHNYNAQPALGVLAQLGIVLSLIYCRYKTFSYPHPRPTCLIWGWLLLTMLPAILANKGVPHAWRTNAMVYPAVMLAAYGIHSFLSDMRKYWQRLFLIAFALMFCISTYTTYNDFFIKWGTHQKTKTYFSTNYYKRRVLHRGYKLPDSSVLRPRYDAFNFVKQARELNESSRNAPASALRPR